jgi:hypothetical protein
LHACIEYVCKNLVSCLVGLVLILSYTGLRWLPNGVHSDFESEFDFDIRLPTGSMRGIPGLRLENLMQYWVCRFTSTYIHTYIHTYVHADLHTGVIYANLKSTVHAMQIAPRQTGMHANTGMICSQQLRQCSWLLPLSGESGINQSEREAWRRIVVASASKVVCSELYLGLVSR